MQKGYMVDYIKLQGILGQGSNTFKHEHLFGFYCHGNTMTIHS